MDSRYIGVFDSGLGGLTAVKEFMHQMPREGIVYFGDTARVPYGTRSYDTIIKYVKSDIRFLMTFDIKIIVIACGTASSVALERVKNDFDIDIVGVVEPTARAALAATKNGRIGIIATPGTISSGKYEKVIKENSEKIETVSAACPLFVPLVENGYADSKVAYMVAEDYLKPLKKAQVDTIIMGCTHYPLLSRVIYDIMDSEVALIDPGAETAKYVKGFLGSHGMLAENKPEDQYKFYVSDLSDSFAQVGGRFLQRGLDNIKKVDIDAY